MAEQNPRVLNDRYEIHRRLARGGMAQVYLARDRSLDRPVAVKELVPEFAADPSFVERFRREAQAAANLSHPNIVGVYDWGAQDGTYFIVMEYIDGPSLSRVLRADGPLHPRRAAEIASETAAGLGFAHSRGVVHRDVKPGNVLLTRTGQAKVTDFGIARALSSPDEDLTQAGSVMGTATYFSPEQAQGLPVDPRSDLYSLGVVLYELVTGRPPFAGETPLAIAYKHVQDDPPPPSTLISDLPEGLEAIIMKLLSKRADDRYASAEELRADLRRFLAGEPTLAERELVAAGAVYADEPATTVVAATTVGAAVPPPVEPDEEPEDKKSRTWLFIVLLLVMLAVLGGLVFWIIQSLDDGDLVTVPPVVGLDIGEARDRLEAVDLEVREVPRPSENLAVGRVISQNPAKDEEVDRGSTVELEVSSGPEQIEMPELGLMTQADAEAKIAELGLRLGTVEQRELADAPAGIVLEQTPPAGTVVAPGDAVNLVVSVEPGKELVPDVVGRPLAQAQAAIQEAGFRFRNPVYEPSDTVNEGSVIRTEPPAGTSLEPNSQITIVVSSGVEQINVPPVVGDEADAAQRELEGAGFVVTRESRTLAPGDSNVGRVTSQTPTGGQQARKGSTVTIVVGVAEATTTTTSSTTTSTTSTSTP